MSNKSRFKPVKLWVNDEKYFGFYVTLEKWLSVLKVITQKHILVRYSMDCSLLQNQTYNLFRQYVCTYHFNI